MARPDRALEFLDEIGSPDFIDTRVREHVLAGERIMGFGHAVYRTEDPRAAMLRDIAQELGVIWSSSRPPPNGACWRSWPNSNPDGPCR